MKEHNFNDSKHREEAHGDLIRAAIRLRYKGADVQKASVEEEKKGVDYWAVFVENAKEKRVAVDAKVRAFTLDEGEEAEGDPGDILLEVSSVTTGEKPRDGWAVDESKITDALLYMVVVNSRVERIQWFAYKPLRKAVNDHRLEWYAKYKAVPAFNVSQHGPDWKTWNLPVPTDVLRAAIKSVMKGAR